MEMRHAVESGRTLSIEFRKHLLISLRDAILEYEEEIYVALHKDLRKSREEAYATEIGQLLTEIRIALKNIRKWSSPQPAKTNLLNFPSSSKIIHDPLGVVLIIAPWNYPFLLSLRPLIGAIAGGNTIVLKPSELAPSSSTLLERMIRETFPKKYVSIVCGDGKKTVQTMMEIFRFDHIFYTGSSVVGKLIYQLAAQELIPVTLELGGKSPAIVEKDASISTAAKRIALGKFINAGQTCVAPDYLLVHRSIKNEFLQKLEQCIKNFYGDNPQQSESYGRIINERNFDRLMRCLDGVKILFGGDHDRKNLFFSPTVVEVVQPNAPVIREEIFGPILPLFTFENIDEALELIATNPSPLAFYLFTENAEQEKSWIKRVRFGGGCINNTIWQLSNHHLPFGGIGNSGIGAYHGEQSFDRFTHAKPIMKTPTWFDPAIKYPPFDGKLKWFKRMIR
ncbi:MAG: aldehyde dehydrogenase family protein [Bacteroidetes bacterium]|nr:MAG: aldehyde dehydrogenase family protein [Bacteroidota bacterium]